MGAITGSIAYRDADAGVQWLVDVLGFEETHDFRAPDGRIGFAELHWKDAAVFVAPTPGGDSPWSAVGPSSLSLAADDAAEVDRIHARAVALGADIVRPPTLSKTPLFPDGSHQFDVRDPGGNLWTIGTYRPSV